MFQTYKTSGLYFSIYSGKPFPKKFYSEKNPLGITKAPGAGS